MVGEQDVGGSWYKWELDIGAECYSGEGAQLSGYVTHNCHFWVGAMVSVASSLDGSVYELPFKLCTSGSLSTESRGPAGGVEELDIQGLP